MERMVKWKRVHGPDLQPSHAERKKLNDATLSSQYFLDACKVAGVEPTRRQARKFRSKLGRAWLARREQ